MTESEISRLLALQKSAYEVLLWIDKRAEHEQELLSDQNLEKWRYPQSCETWVRDIVGMFPAAFRPAEEDIPAFARLFSSFFQTSFRVTENGPKVDYHKHWGEEAGWIGSGRRRLMAGAPNGKKSSAGREKIGETAHELRLIALEGLALQNDLLLGRDNLKSVERSPSLDADVTLWTYVHELERRAEFASQGEAVRSLWLAMTKKERENLKVEKILKAQERLLVALQAKLA